MTNMYYCVKNYMYVYMYVLLRKDLHVHVHVCTCICITRSTNRVTAEGEGMQQAPYRVEWSRANWPHKRLSLPHTLIFT